MALGERQVEIEVGGLAPGVAFLLVDGNRVMDLGIDTGLVEVVKHLIPLLDLNHVQVEDVPVTGLFGRQLEPGVLQALGVHGRNFAAAIAPFGNLLELDAENPGMDVVEAAVEAKAVNVAFV